MNAGGADKARELGAINYVGSDEYVAGVRRVARISPRPGKKNVICVNTLPGAANTEARCKGVIDGMTAGGGTANNCRCRPPALAIRPPWPRRSRPTLLKDATIDGVITISARRCGSAAIGIQQSGADHGYRLGSFDMNQAGLDRIKGGTQAFAIDQQPYLQTFPCRQPAGLGNRLWHLAADLPGADRPGHRRCVQHRRHAGRRDQGRALILHLGPPHAAGPTPPPCQHIRGSPMSSTILIRRPVAPPRGRGLPWPCRRPDLLRHLRRRSPS